MQPLTLPLTLLCILHGAPGAISGGLASGRVPGDHLRMELLTIGPGSATWSRFGHSALRVTDLRGRGDIVFDFGTFDDEQPNVVGRFLTGRLRYYLSVTSYPKTVRDYSAEGRLIVAQQLRLSGPQKLRLFRRLRHLAQPANKHYRYHHFTNNCATRIRDELDQVLGGQIRKQLATVAAGTYRQWIRRATRGAPGFHALFDLVLTWADGPVSLWQAAFAPEALHDGLAHVRIHGTRAGRASGGAGRGAPLVRATRIVRRGEGFAARRGDSRTWVVAGLFVLLGLVLLPLLRSTRSALAWRIAGGAVVGWGVFQILAAAVMLGLQIYSTVAQFLGNQHLAILSPAGLWIAYVGLRFLRHGARPGSVSRWMVRIQALILVVPLGVFLCWPAPNPWPQLWICALLLNLALLLILLDARRRPALR